MPLPRFRNKSRIAVALSFLFLLYWGLVPPFLPLPKLTVEMPAEARMDEDVPIAIRLDAWHPNFHVMQVRFYTDYGRTDVDGPKGPFYPQVLFQSEERAVWTRGRINRFAWPRHREMEVVLPLAQLTRDGVVRPGTVVGKIDVTLNVPDLHRRTFHWGGERYHSIRTVSEPFEIQFVAASE